MANDPIIEPAELAEIGTFHLLDVRDQAAFTAGHVPGAVRVPIENWEAAAKADDTSLDNTGYWESTIAKLGLHNETLAVVYDDGRMTEAARVWFILQYFGAKAAILNGGWPAVAAISVSPGSQESSRPEGNFRAHPGSGIVGLIDRHGLGAELGSSMRICDVRSAAEYVGEDLRRNARGGHLPGARHLPHSRLLDGGRVRAADDLRHLLVEAGLQADDPIVTHCDGGGRAALAAAAAVRAGYSNLRVYYLSFADWARDESCPIVRE